MPVIKSGTLASGNLKGEQHGATISLILDESEPGHGPRLHQHPYDETWVVIAGNLTFQAGDERLAAGPGDIVIVPPGLPQVHQRRPRTLEARLHPRKRNLRHRVARVTTAQETGQSRRRRLIRRR